MKRKIAAIFAADIAGYSKLVAEDEEETLRRLASYRSVMDDFIARAGGRIFNTAGDAVLAEFPSAVEAVRCAIDIQESLRTRNMAYPASRQMSFRIGITVGDVVERDGDLLGDGVNIAARLEGIAPIGGICISRTVHEQVANKLSVVFADIGEQHVKNIPNSGPRLHVRDAAGRRATRTAGEKAGIASGLAVASRTRSRMRRRARRRGDRLFHHGAAGRAGRVKCTGASRDDRTASASATSAAADRSAGAGSGSAHRRSCARYRPRRVHARRGS